MAADAWWRGTAAVSVASAGILGVAGLAPLLIRAAPQPGAAVPSLDLVCLFLPTQADWAAHLLSYAILALLGISCVRGLGSLLSQVRRTRHAVRGLLRLARPLDPALQPWLQALGLMDRVDLIATAVPLAFCYGIRRPRICLSTGMLAALPPQALTALLWHEHYHLLHRDPRRVALGRAWTAMFFFLPLPQALYARYVVAKEVDADAYACAQQGSPAPLAAALYALLDWDTGRSRRVIPPTSAGATEALEIRIAWLLGQPVPSVLPLAPILWTGVVLIAVLTLELALTQAGVGNTLWFGSHAALGGC